MAKSTTLDQMEDCMERTSNCIAGAASAAAEAIQEMGNVLSETMTGATSAQAGTSGMVPAPAAGANTKFLRGDGSWANLSDTVFVVSTTTQTGNVMWIKPTDL